jgi:two-component system, LuxR family, sensor kinase FixL
MQSVEETNNSEYALPLETTLVEEKTRALFSSIPVSLAASLLLAAILSTSHWNIVARDHLILWNIFLFCTVCFRYASWHLWRNYRDSLSFEAWLLIFRIGTFLTGSAWGSSALFIFAHANPTYQALLAFTLGGISSGSLTTLAVDKISAMSFVVLAITPLSLRLFIENGPIAIPMGAMSSIYILFVLTASTRAYKSLQDQHKKNTHLIAWGRERTQQQQMAKSISLAQSNFIQDSDSVAVFNKLLRSAQELTDSPYGFIGEVSYVENKEILSKIKEARSDTKEIGTSKKEPRLKLLTFLSLHNNKEFSEFCEKHPPEGYLFTNMENLFGAAIVTGKPVISNQPAKDTRASGTPTGHPKISAFLGIPIYNGTTLVGLLAVANKPSGYDNKLVDFLNPITNTIAQFFEAIKHNREQKEFEEKIQNNAKHTQAILDEVFDAIITLNEQGAIDSFNHSAETIFGYQEHEIVGVHIEQLVPQPKDTLLPALKRTQRLYQMPTHLYTMDRDQELVGVGRKGNQFPIDFAISEFIKDKKRFFICVIRDISERKRNEELKKQFISTVSHELRTPLTSISGALGILNSTAIGPLNEHQTKLTTIALQNSLRLQHLVDDLLDMEKLLANKMAFNIERHNIVELVKKSIEANQLYADQYQVSVILLENPEPCYLLGDASRIQQVMANLLSNAAKFSYPNSTVEISITQTGKLTRVSVKDQGKGISEQFRSRIFDRFTQADSSDTRQKGGSGLGLAISKELIQRMGGQIDFSSAPGTGSCFYFDLPTSKHVPTSEQPTNNQPR